MRLVERYHTDFVRAGANLTEGQENRVKAINGEMATLTTTVQPERAEGSERLGA